VSGELPAGWKAAFTKDGRPYFVNRAMRKSTWTDPRMATRLSLPDGWEQATDEDGEVYYIDHINKRTQRQAPVKPARALGSADATAQNGNDDNDENDVGDDAQPQPRPDRHRRSMTKQHSNSSLTSWGSISSLISSVSSLTRTMSTASLNSFNSAKALLTGSEEDALSSSFSSSSPSSSSSSSGRRPSFLASDTPKPGILPKLNDAFWSLVREDQAAAPREDGDDSAAPDSVVDPLSSAEDGYAVMDNDAFSQPYPDDDDDHDHELLDDISEEVV
jgi:hypothetical protein